MNIADISLPYFDILLEKLTLGDADVKKAFGRHVHWGYWSHPTQADGSAEDFAKAAEHLSQKVYTAAEVKENDHILDAGCGFGGTIASLNEQFQHLHLTGLNIDPRQLERASQAVKHLANNQIEFVEGDACKMPFPDASMDVVLAVECIFHFPSRAKFFREAQRVLRPGGRLGICNFVPIPLFRTLQSWLSNFTLEDPDGIYGRVDNLTTLSDYYTLAQQTGFQLKSQEDITRQTLPTYPFVCGMFKKIGSDRAARTTASLGKASQFGLMRYQILSFAVE